MMNMKKHTITREVMKTWSQTKKYENFEKNYRRRRKIKLIGESFNPQRGAFGVGSLYPRSWSYPKYGVLYPVFKYAIVYMC